ncbi:MAG: TIGR03617 family F420-dependent LLM class oxidoreductase [Acidimicrobiia bacterium]
MKVDAIVNRPLSETAEAARAAEAAGFDGMVSVEIANDPFLPVALAAQSTERIDLLTGIAVAFARNPMNVAVIANDLNRFSGGRFVLGLGSQIRPHITKRFSMPWSDPARRMREFVLAVRAIWNSWNTGEPLAFRGEFYRHTLMTPMFDQGPSDVPDPRVFVAAVGPAMTRTVGEVADGLLAHGFTTAAYLREVTLANLDVGLRASGRTRADIEVSVPVMCAVGRDEDEIAERLPALRRQLAFYGSTPAYRGVLEHHGWGELGDELNRLSKRGEWVAMGDAIDDDVVREFAVVGDAATVAAEIRQRFDGLVDRVQTGLVDEPLPLGT